MDIETVKIVLGISIMVLGITSFALDTPRVIEMLLAMTCISMRWR